MKLLKNPKKSLGQNFLIDQNIINKILNVGDINEKKVVLEIGAGYGNLTNKIADKHPKKIYAVEKDRMLSAFLKKKFANFNNVIIIENDILNILKEEKLENNVIVFGNLPYNISTKIIASFILLKKWPPWYNSLIFMFQKEVADRIIAKTRSKNFGRLSVLCNWRLEIKKHFDISRNCFLPKPKVNSSLLSFKPKKKNKFIIKNPKNLETVTRILFSSRRKMVNKSFSRLFKDSETVAKDLNLNLKSRPEELSCEMFYKITMKYEGLIN